MKRWRLWFATITIVLALVETGCLVASDVPPPKSRVSKGGASGDIPCPIFPANDVWNTPIDQLLPDERTSLYLENMDPQDHLHAGFGSGRTGLWGVAYVVGEGKMPMGPITLAQAEDSDHGPFPIPRNASVEHSPNGVLSVIDARQCVLYEYLGLHQDADGDYSAKSAAIFDLRAHILRRTGTWSADAAGLPIFPGLARYEEVAAGEVEHALRFTASHTRKLAVWPARHADSNIFDAGYPPMGARFRLKASFPIDGFSQPTRVILKTLQKYGMFLADNGPAWTISGSPDRRWNDAQLAELERVPPSAFEMVDETPLISDVNLAIARQDVRPTASPGAPAEPEGKPK
jgi:hypothetical protein